MPLVKTVDGRCRHCHLTGKVIHRVRLLDRVPHGSRITHVGGGDVHTVRVLRREPCRIPRGPWSRGAIEHRHVMAVVHQSMNEIRAHESKATSYERANSSSLPLGVERSAI